MKRSTGTYRTTEVAGEKVRAFVPHPLPPRNPRLGLTGGLAGLHAEAVSAIQRLEVAGGMVPSPDWFLYGFVRKEAVVSSQIEGTQATLEDVVAYEATREAERPADVEEVCNYVDAMQSIRRHFQSDRQDTSHHWRRRYSQRTKTQTDCFRTKGTSQAGSPKISNRKNPGSRPEIASGGEARRCAEEPDKYSEKRHHKEGQHCTAGEQANATSKSAEEEKELVII